jgi:hypothetical protein
MEANAHQPRKLAVKNSPLAVTGPLEIWLPAPNSDSMAAPGRKPFETPTRESFHYP